MRNLLVVTVVAIIGLPGCYMPGLVSTADHTKSATAADSLGAKVVRMEFNIGAPATSLDADMANLGAKGIQMLPLAGGCGNLPTQAQAFNLGNWAERFGPGGTFWDTHVGVPVTTIELCNETSYRNGAPDGPGAGDDWWASQSYLDRASNYGLRAAQAIYAITVQSDGVSLAVQGDNGGSGSPNWVNQMIATAPSLKTSVGGWVVHPYGPASRYQPKLQSLLNALAGQGISTSVPIDVTEYGISSDNGVALTDNYGWPVNQTFAQAATSLDQGVSGIRGMLGDRLRHFMIYSATDNQNPGVTTDREAYFGCLRLNLAEKGAYSTECRDQLDE